MTRDSLVAHDGACPLAIAPKRGSLTSSRTCDVVQQAMHSGPRTGSFAEDPGDPSLGHPQRGVSVEHLRTEFLEGVRAAGFGSEAKIYELEPLVIRGKGVDVVCPRDGRPGAAYVDAIRGPEAAGPSTHMLSYTWGYAIGDVVGSLVRYCESHGLPPARTYVWICCLCVNQHRVKQAEASGEVIPFEDFRAAFEGQVRGIGRVLALMAPWQSPRYITRVWCVFEIFTATQLGPEACEVSIIMPPAEFDAFAADLARGGRGVSGIWEACRRLRVQDAEASVEEDKRRILKLIECGVGFAALNSSVRSFLQQWFIDTAVFHVTELLSTCWGCTEDTLLPACFSVGRFLMHMGKQDKAIELLNQAIEMAKEMGTIKTMNGASVLRLKGFITCVYKGNKDVGCASLKEAKSVYEDLGKLETAEGAELLMNMSMTTSGPDVLDEFVAYIQEAKRILVACDQLTSPVGGEVMGMTGFWHLHCGNIAFAVKSFAEMKRIRIAVDTLQTPDGSKALWGFAQANFYRGNLDEAVAQMKEALEIRTDLGVLMTTISAAMLSFQSYVALERGSLLEAAELSDRALEVQRASPNDAWAVVSLDVRITHAYVRVAQGKLDEASIELEDGRSLYEETLSHVLPRERQLPILPAIFRFTTATLFVHLRRGDLEAAAAAVDAARRLLDPCLGVEGVPDGLMPDGCSTLVMVGLVRLGQGAESAALDCLERALAGYARFSFQGGPGEARAQHVLGRIHAAGRRWNLAADALQASKRSLERMRTLETPAGAALLATLGAVQAAQALLPQAVGTLEEADRIQRSFAAEERCAQRLASSLSAARLLRDRVSEGGDDEETRAMKASLEANASF